jgi:hypothetical protein
MIFLSHLLAVIRLFILGTDLQDSATFAFP